MRSLYESLLDDEEEVMNKTKLVPLMKIMDVKSKKDYDNTYNDIVDQFKLYEENKLHTSASSIRNMLNLGHLKNDDVIILFSMGGITIGYNNLKKYAIRIFFSQQTNETDVSIVAPIGSQSIPPANKGTYKLPSAYKEDFEKIVKKYQKERKGRIL